MSCPDWKTLATWRDDPRAEEPAEWREALTHLDRGCSLCRRAALAADPTLVFRRLGAPGALRDRLAVSAPAPAQESSEVDAMRRSVAAMMAASRVEAVERRGRSVRAKNWTRWVAAAALAVVALSLPASSPDTVQLRRERMAASLLSETGAMMPTVLSAARPGSLAFPAAALPAAATEDLPTLEGVNRPGARVYHMDGEGMSVVMIVDETLDV